ncbi:MAG TPA: hypothetical protein VH593_12945 [Ktedonobacteraceae bacterium]|jgi:hypothetical protein
MTIENIVQAWKNEEELDAALPNPVGEELSEQELTEIAGGMPCAHWYTCWVDSCGIGQSICAITV